jgi:hypothetical protein
VESAQAIQGRQESLLRPLYLMRWFSHSVMTCLRKATVSSAVMLHATHHTPTPPAQMR